MKTLKRLKLKKAIILDRDGVINEMVYNPRFGTIDSPLNPKELKILKGADRAIELFREMGFLVVVASNQPIIAKGKTSQELFKKIDDKIKRELKRRGTFLDGIYYCFHHPDRVQVKVKKYLKICGCRKPRPGLLLRAARELNFNLKKSFMIGDGLTDIQAGKAAGCKTIFLGTKKAYLWEAMNSNKIRPDFIAKNLLEAVKIIKKNN